MHILFARVDGRTTGINLSIGDIVASISGGAFSTTAIPLVEQFLWQPRCEFWENNQHRQADDLNDHKL